MKSLSADLLHCIFEYVQSPFDLLTLAAVCKTFHLVSRSDRCWERQKARILKRLPLLEPLFDKLNKNKRRKPNNNNKGIWFVFARHLMFKNISHVLKRKSSSKHVIPAICAAAVNPNVILDVVQRSHPKFEMNFRFQCCICLQNYTFIWIAIPKGSSRVQLYSDKCMIETTTVDELLWNFKQLIRNDDVKKVYKYVYY